MKIIKNLGKWTIYQITGIRTEYTGRPDEIYPYYVAFDGIHFPIEGKTLESVQSDIAEIQNL